MVTVEEFVDTNLWLFYGLLALSALFLVGTLVFVVVIRVSDWIRKRREPPPLLAQPPVWEEPLSEDDQVALIMGVPVTLSTPTLVSPPALESPPERGKIES